MSKIGLRGRANKQIANFRDYNEPKRRGKQKSSKKRLPPKTTKGFK